MAKKISGKGHPAYNPRCPKCGCTSDRVARDRYRCRVRGCRIFFKALDPDLSQLQIDGFDQVKSHDKVHVGLERGTPTDNPRCPFCDGSSDKLSNGMLRCRVRGCRREFPESVN